MLTYHYQCNDCQYEFEERQSIKASPLTICPHCKKKTLERVMHITDIFITGIKTMGQLAECHTKQFKPKPTKADKDVMKVIKKGKEAIDKYVETGET